MRFGRKPFAELLALPRSNTPTAAFHRIQSSLASGGAREQPARWPDSAEHFLSMVVHRASEIFKNPGLAASYRLVAQDGARHFTAATLRGESSRGVKPTAVKSLKDFADDKATWIDPVSTNYRGYDVWELPQRSGHRRLADSPACSSNTMCAECSSAADYLHLFLEPKKLAFADRAHSSIRISAPPVARLISKEYARSRRS
jgi:gamma-glutamyltranspeptidase/glutathione hydrolase